MLATASPLHDKIAPRAVPVSLLFSEGEHHQCRHVRWTIVVVFIDAYVEGRIILVCHIRSGKRLYHWLSICLWSHRTPYPWTNPTYDKHLPSQKWMAWPILAPTCIKSGVFALASVTSSDLPSPKLPSPPPKQLPPVQRPGLLAAVRDNWSYCGLSYHRHNNAFGYGKPASW